MPSLRSSVRPAVLAAASCAVLATAAAPAASAHPATHLLRSGGSAAGSYTTAAAAQRANSRGFTWLVGKAVGLPAGTLRVLIYGKHGASLTKAVKFTVSQQRRYGVPVRFAGGTSKRSVKDAIVVYNWSHGHCTEANEAGYGGFKYYYNGNGVTVSWYGYAQICPLAYKDHLLSDTVLHEMGHSVNLGHYRAKFHGKHQVMFPIVYRSVHNYRAGDVNGLRAVARHHY